MFIQTEATPNPATLKFIPGREVLASGSADFPNPEAAAGSLLARRLFEIESVERVFFGVDFISVTKSDGEWPHLKPAILGVIMEHFTADLPVMDKAQSAESDAEDDDTVRQIKELLDTRVRPVVAQDGGDIVYHGFEDGIVYLHMQGACAGCPSSSMTLKHGIENMLRHYIPEVVEVRQI
jgi:Fe-S cluster biogenesis protein NfuA